ncbi:MAG: insulinase family protein, partial [Chlamydiota bacterium]
NEMKGSLSSPDTRMWHAMMERLMPDLPYAYNSGGDPREIPNLTYAELINFHETFYHPSHCLFFFYGNIPLKQHLDFIAEKALKNVPPSPSLPPIPLQKRFSQPVQEKMRYPINEADSIEQRTIISFGFLTAPLIDQEEVLALSVLDSVLMETDASVLKQALLKSKLCIQADGFMDAEMSEAPYVIVCKGCDAQNADKLEETLLQALSQVIEKGIPQDQIDAAIHQLEFSRLEISGDHAPFGLTLFMRSALAKQHGCDPEHALALQTLFEGLIAKVKDPAYLPGLIKKYFLSNSHRVRLTMVPDPHLSAEEIAQEKQALKEIHDHLTETKTQLILSQTQELAEFQKKTEEQSLDCLPKVTLDDVSTIARDFPLKHARVGNLDVYHHDCFTNHIIYADLIFDMPEIADENLPLVHLMTSLIPEIGSGARTYAQNLDYLQAHTGGIGAACGLHIQMSDPKSAKPSFSLRGKALYRKADKLFSLLRDTITRPRFDEAKRIEELILQIRDSQLTRLNRQAMRYATHLALS